MSLPIVEANLVLPPPVTEIEYNRCNLSTTTFAEFHLRDAATRGVRRFHTRHPLWDMFRDKEMLVSPALYVHYLYYWLHSGDPDTQETAEACRIFATCLLDKKDFYGKSCKLFRGLVQRDYTPQCRHCYRYIVHEKACRHGRDVCSKFRAGDYIFPGYGLNRLCLLCFKTFSSRNIPKLLKHLETCMPLQQFQYLGYWQRLFDLIPGHEPAVSRTSGFGRSIVMPQQVMTRLSASHRNVAKAAMHEESEWSFFV